MEVVYYKDKSLNCCPVEKYFKQYVKNSRDNTKGKNRKDKILAEINGRIQIVLQNNGVPPPSQMFRKLSGYDYFEIKARKNQNILIRVFYFCHGDKIVLLNALEKPADYKDGIENRKIEKKLKITQDYLNNFKLNPKLYEKYGSEIS